jgi:hypothetical protein
MMDDREARLQPKRFFRKIRADVCIGVETSHCPYCTGWIPFSGPGLSPF